MPMCSRTPSWTRCSARLPWGISASFSRTAFAGADSLALLREVMARLHAEGYVVGNMDCTVLAQAPKLAPYIMQMRRNLAQCMDVDVDRISIKATTEEGLGFTGAREGIAAHAVVLLEKQA